MFRQKPQLPTNDEGLLGAGNTTDEGDEEEDPVSQANHMVFGEKSSICDVTKNANKDERS